MQVKKPFKVLRSNYIQVYVNEILNWKIWNIEYVWYKFKYFEYFLDIKYGFYINTIKNFFYRYSLLLHCIIFYIIYLFTGYVNNSKLIIVHRNSNCFTKQSTYSVFVKKTWNAQLQILSNNSFNKYTARKWLV